MCEGETEVAAASMALFSFLSFFRRISAASFFFCSSEGLAYQIIVAMPTSALAAHPTMEATELKTTMEILNIDYWLI